jgi:undecaprenyl-diphosphatase
VRGCLLYLLLVFIAIPITIYIAEWVYHLLLSELDVAAPIAAVLLGAVLIAIFGTIALVHYYSSIRTWLGGLLRRLGRALLATGLPQWLARRFPRLARFVREHIARSSATGMVLVTVLLAASAAVWFFVVLLIQVVTGGTLTGTDTRIINLVATLRTPGADTVMFILTVLSNAQTVAVISAVAILFALLLARYEDALLIFLALGASSLFLMLVKLLVARPRPPLETARIVQGGFSFPSGHSTISATLFGTLAYLAIRALRSEPAKILIGIVAALLVLGVGISRVYLGVHYPTDVLAGWASGALWVLLVIAAEDLFPPKPKKLVPAIQRAADVVALVALLSVGGLYLATVYREIPPPPRVTPAPPQVVTLDTVPSVVKQSLPLYTEGLFGSRQEPVSLIFIGSRADLEAAFSAGGWTEAAPFGFGSVVGGFTAAISGRGDPDGPVTPSFLGDQPNALAFNLPVGSTFAKRHHIRFWPTDVVTTDGRPIWEATASFDEGFELAPSSGFPTHHIAPNIDMERDFVAQTLNDANTVSQERSLQLVPPETGHNFAGDPFHTNGIAIILDLNTARLAA